MPVDMNDTIGTCIWQMWVVSMLCVDAKLRHRGIASRLVRAAASAAGRRGCDCSAVIVSNIYSER